MLSLLSRVIGTVGVVIFLVGFVIAGQSILSSFSQKTGDLSPDVLTGFRISIAGLVVGMAGALLGPVTEFGIHIGHRIFILGNRNKVKAGDITVISYQIQEQVRDIDDWINYLGLRGDAQVQRALRDLHSETDKVRPRSRAVRARLDSLTGILGSIGALVGTGPGLADAIQKLYRTLALG